MRRILDTAEPLRQPSSDDPGNDAAMILARDACDLATRIGARAIVVPTQSGASVRNVARWRPAVPIVALTADPTLRRRLSVVWGVTAFMAPWIGSAAPLERFRETCLASGTLSAGAQIVLVAGWPRTEHTTTNLLHVATI